jgi:hypothetical protein
MNGRDDNSCEAGMEQLFAFLLDAATKALKYDGLDKTPTKDDQGQQWASEKECLERAKAEIQDHSKSLITMVRQAEKDGFHLLSHELIGLFVAAYNIGRLGNVTNSAKTF